MSKQIRKPAFDTKANYKWEPTDLFQVTLTGQQFASLYHLVSQEMNNVGGAPVALKVEAHGVVMGVFNDLVEEGAIEKIAEGEITPSDEGNVRKLFKK